MITRLEVYGQWLRNNPAGFAVYMIYFVVCILLSLILHECAHGWAALQCGDPTARMMGRLTLDPRRHLDPVGTICMFLLGFGWARPVPVNPRNFRNPRRDDFLVSIAGIAVNMTLFIVCAGLSVLIFRLMLGADLLVGTGVAERGLLYTSVKNNILYSYRPSLPEEWTALMAVPWLQYLLRFFGMMAQINLSLAVFNLLPIPPLDGFRLLNNALRGRLRMSQQAFQAVRVALLALCLTGALSRVLSVVTDALDSAVTNVFLLI